MFTVIYYMGGKESGQWRRCSSVATAREAVAQVADIERGGRPALYHETRVWDAVGLPEGAPHWWDFATLAPKKVA